MSDLQALRSYLESQRDFNLKWIPVHENDGHSIAANYRRKHVAELQSWLDALATTEADRLKEAIRKHRETWMRPGADEELYAALGENRNA